jgi:carbon starvation protein
MGATPMMLAIVLFSAAFLSLAYVSYGAMLSKLLGLRRDAVTPAFEFRDDVDYEPLDRGPLLSQHFSAIAAAGPIVGPVFAGAMFGWAPALIWILLGAVFVGGVHDMTALLASVRHRGESIAEVVREHVSHRSFVLFLAFIWLALIYIIVAFTDITAASFVGSHTLESGETISGAGIATSSMLYLALPIVMGLLVRFTRLSMGKATALFLPLVGAAIWLGQDLPLDMTGLVERFVPGASPEQAEGIAHKAWDIALLAYCCVASAVPMWLLLQPRGQLGGCFLYAALAAGAVGLIFGGEPVHLPAFTGWSSPRGEALFPMLFITIACGACSGFHALIASGTSSKQLRRETDARPVGYGAMLLEAMVAIVSLCCVMMLAPGSELLANPKPNFIYAQGIGTFLQTIGIPASLGVAFALMAFTTFVYDTLDVCTRLGRYVVQELTGWRDARGRWLGTLLTAGTPLLFVMQTTLGANGKPIPVWQTFWSLFGASNQLLAALTLLGVTVWLWRTRRAWWVWPVFGVPTVWMYCMSTWALVGMIGDYWKLVTAEGSVQTVTYVLFGITTLLVVLAALMLIEAVCALLPRSRPTDDGRTAVPAPATA